MKSTEESFLAGCIPPGSFSSKDHLTLLLPHGYVDTHSAEDVRKFLIVQGMTSILALSHIAVLGFTMSGSPHSSPSFFAFTMGLVLLLELAVLFLLRYKRDVTQAALLLAFSINLSTLGLCIHYGVVAELYIWLGWVPKILSFTYGGQGGLVGLIFVLVQGAIISLLHAHGLVQPQHPSPECACGAEALALAEIDQSARLLHINAYLICFALTTAVHEYTRAHILQELRDALVEMQQANAGLKAAAEAKSIFLASTSHELRTPLHGILALSESLLDGAPESKDLRKSLRTISESGKHLIEVLNKSLDFEKLHSGKLVLEAMPFSATHETELICATFAALIDKKKITLVKDFTVDSSLLHLGDPLRFRQVVCNLLSNAIKFTPRGGTIRIALSTKGDVLRVAVTDTGMGISQETQAKLFQDFVQGDSSISRKYGGTGLGLAITKRFVDAMHGDIGCRSQEGQGSTFWFEIPLPLVEGLPASGDETGEPESRESAGDLQGKRVLLVDDNVINQKLGCEAVVASNGQECLDILQNRPDHFDVILMDFLMPVLGDKKH